MDLQASKSSTKSTRCPDATSNSLTSFIPLCTALGVTSAVSNPPEGRREFRGPGGVCEHAIGEAQQIYFPRRAQGDISPAGIGVGSRTALVHPHFDDGHIHRVKASGWR